MQYAILNFDLASVREYRDLDENNFPAVKWVNGEPLVRPVLWDDDPVFDSATETLEEITPIIELNQVRRRRVVVALEQSTIDELAERIVDEAEFDTIKDHYDLFDGGTATVAQVQKAIAWLIKQEAKQRGLL